MTFRRHLQSRRLSQEAIRWKKAYPAQMFIVSIHYIFCLLNLLHPVKVGAAALAYSTTIIWSQVQYPLWANSEIHPSFISLISSSAASLQLNCGEPKTLNSIHSSSHPFKPCCQMYLICLSKYMSFVSIKPFPQLSKVCYTATNPYPD